MLFILYFVLWVIFNGRWTLEIGAFGLIFAALLYAFSCRFLGWSVKKDLHRLRLMPGTFRYIGMLIGEIIAANLAVMRIILSPAAEVKPKLVRFRTPLKTKEAQVALADSITLTPGTITAQVKDGVFTVHCLDESMEEGLMDGVFVQRLTELEKEAQA